jgi:predicted aminopeptidase
LNVARGHGTARRRRVVSLRLVYSRPHTSENVTAALTCAFERFLQLYAQFGQHRFHGSADWKDPQTYRGADAVDSG